MADGTTLKSRLWCLIHNVVIHPTAGLFWAVGLERWGDIIHNFGKTGVE